MIEALENRRLVVQAELDAKKTQEERNKMGQFATPSPLARDILLHAKALLPSKGKVMFLDPALGSGAFYAALRRVFEPKAIEKATAFEIDPHYGKPAEALWAEHGLQLIHGDFTHAEPEPIHNLIICNPPYVRHHHLSGDDKLRLGKLSYEASGSKLSGLAGLYCHFLLQAHAWMAPGAIAGWLIPSEFMDVNYGREVKRYLLNQVSLLQIHRFEPDDVQFADALVSSAIVWIKKTRPAVDHEVNFTFGGSLAEPHHSRMVSNKDLASEDKWTRFPRLEVRPTNEGATLSDLFAIKRGLATGDNGFFVLDEEQVKEHNIPDKALRPILPSPRHIEGLAVEANGNGLPTNARRLFLLDPRMDQDEIDAKHPDLASYLAKGKNEGLSERYLCKSRKRWYDQEQRPPAPIVCTYIGRSDSKSGRPFRFIRNRSQATVANSYLAMYPKPALEALLAKDPGLIDRLWEQMNRIAPETLLGEGRVYGGGMHKLEPKELGKVPMELE